MHINDSNKTIPSVTDPTESFEFIAESYISLDIENVDTLESVKLLLKEKNQDLKFFINNVNQLQNKVLFQNDELKKSKKLISTLQKSFSIVSDLNSRYEKKIEKYRWLLEVDQRRKIKNEKIDQFYFEKISNLYTNFLNHSFKQSDIGHNNTLLNRANPIDKVEILNFIVTKKITIKKDLPFCEFQQKEDNVKTCLSPKSLYKSQNLNVARNLNLPIDKTDIPRMSCESTSQKKFIQNDLNIYSIPLNGNTKNITQEKNLMASIEKFSQNPIKSNLNNFFQKKQCYNNHSCQNFFQQNFIDNVNTPEHQNLSDLMQPQNQRKKQSRYFLEHKAIDSHEILNKNNNRTNFNKISYYDNIVVPTLNLMKKGEIRLNVSGNPKMSDLNSISSPDQNISIIKKNFSSVYNKNNQFFDESDICKQIDLFDFLNIKKTLYTNNITVMEENPSERIISDINESKDLNSKLEEIQNFSEPNENNGKNDPKTSTKKYRDQNLLMF